MQRWSPRVAHAWCLGSARPLNQRLLATLDGCAQVFDGEPVPAFDLHCPLMSPAVLAFGTTLETIPPPARLAPPADAVAEWRRRLAPLPTPRVGPCWAGAPRRDDPAARAIDRRRSITLAHYASLAGVAGPTLIAPTFTSPLQKGEAAVQAATPDAGISVHD